MGAQHSLSRRRFLKGAGLGAAGLALAACAAPAAEPAAGDAEAPDAEIPEVVFWFPWEDPALNIQDKFNEAGLGVTAVWQLGEYDSNTKTMAALAAGTPPPVSFLGRWQSGDLAVRDALVVLDDYIEGAQNFTWDNIWERLQKDSILWGKKWIVPYTTDTRALLYNRTVMGEAGLDPDAPPLTWDELHQMAIDITEQDEAGRLDVIGFTPTFGNPPVHLMFLTLIWCLDSDMVNEDLTEVTITDKGEEAMVFLKQVMDDQGGYEAAGAFTRGLSLAEGIDAFSAGKVGLAMHGQWVLRNYDKYTPDLDFGMIPGPVFPEYDIHANYDGGGGWFLFKEGGQPDDAWALVDFCMGEEFYLDHANQFAWLPARSDVGKQWATFDERREVFAATANTVRWIPIFVGILETLGDIATMFDNILIGGKDIASELEIAEEKIQAVLDRHNEFPVPS